MSEIDENIIVDNSPIEFVLIGPRGDQDAVLVRTKDAKMDLIGFGLDPTDEDRYRQRRSVLFPMQSDEYGMACIRTLLHSPIESDEKRAVQYSLCVRALLNSEDINVAKNLLIKSIYSIRVAINEWDKLKFERAIAPIVFFIMQKHIDAGNRYKRAKLTRMLVFGTYGMMLIIYALWSLYRFLPIPKF